MPMAEPLAALIGQSEGLADPNHAQRWRRLDATPVGDSLRFRLQRPDAIER